MYLLLAIGWHGGEELAAIKPSSVGHIVGFMATGFVLNFVIGVIAYLLLSRMTAMRRVDKATVAGYYGSDSAGTFATCVGLLTGVGLVFDAYMPVMLAVMEVPGCQRRRKSPIRASGGLFTDNAGCCCQAKAARRQ